MSDLSPTKIAFPPPPPTCNTLTAAQRNHLLKSTKKLGQLLGATPQVLDETYPLGPLLVQLHFGTLRAHSKQTTQHYRRGSLDSISSICSSYESSSSASPIVSGLSSPSSDYLDAHSDSWRAHHVKKRPPLFRLSRSDSIKGESVLLDPVTPTTASPTSSPTDETHYFFSVPQRDSRSSLYAEAPSFVIPSETTMRREKMARVRRKLGDGVPIGLVFPSQSQSELDLPPQYPPKPAAATAPATTPTSTSTVQLQNQPRLTVHYGATSANVHPESNAIPERNNLGPIIENVDEQTSSSCSYDRGSSTPRRELPAEDDVDVDLDKMLYQFVQHIGLRRRLWSRKGHSVSEFEMVSI